MFPGKVLRYGDDRARDYKPEDDAVITLQQLRLFVTKAIVDVHHQGVDEWTGERRIDLWTKSVAINPPRRVRAHDDLVELVGAYETRKAERRGLRLFGLRYNSSDLAQYRAGFEKDPRVEVRYDPQEIGHVTLIDHDKGFTLRVPCTRPQYAVGLSLHQHRVIQRRAKDRSPEGLIRIGALVMAKAELFELGKSMLKVRRGRGRLTKVAQFLGIGREVIDLMSRRREDVEESAVPLDLTEDDVSDPEDDRTALADESLVETFRDGPERKSKAMSKPRTSRSKAGRTASPRQPDVVPAAEPTITPVPPRPAQSRTPSVRRKMKVIYDD
jgi:putative transposase